MLWRPFVAPKLCQPKSKMHAHGIVPIAYDAHIHTTAQTSHANRVALAALKNLPGGTAFAQHHVSPKHTIKSVPRPPIQNFKLHGPYFEGR